MTTVWLRDGTSRDMSPEDAKASYLAGEGAFAPGTYNVINSKGQREAVDRGRLKGELLTGGRFTTLEEDEHEDLVRSWDSAGGALVTGLAESASVVTLGLSDTVGAAVDEDFAENRRAMQEANPGTVLGSQIITEGAILLSTLGAGAAARAGGSLAAKGARAITPALGASAKIAGLEATLASGGTIGRKAIASAAAGAAETAVFSSGQAVSQLSIQEEDVTAEHVFARVGDVLAATALGGGLGGTLGLISAGVGAATKNVGRRIGTLREWADGRVVTTAARDADDVGRYSERLNELIKSDARTDRLTPAHDALIGRVGKERALDTDIETSVTRLKQVEAEANALGTSEPGKQQVAGIAKDFDILNEDGVANWGVRSGELIDDLGKELGLDKAHLKSASQLDSATTRDIDDLTRLRDMMDRGPAQLEAPPVTAAAAKVARKRDKLIEDIGGQSEQEAVDALAKAEADVAALADDITVPHAKSTLEETRLGMPTKAKRDAADADRLKQAHKNVEFAKTELRDRTKAAKAELRIAKANRKRHVDLGEASGDVKFRAGDATRKQHARFNHEVTKLQEKLTGRGVNWQDPKKALSALETQRGEARLALDMADRGPGRTPLTDVELAGREKIRRLYGRLVDADAQVRRRGFLDSRDMAESYLQIHKFKQGIGAIAGQRSRAPTSIKMPAQRIHGRLRAMLTDGDLVGPQRARKASDFDRKLTTYYDKRGGLRHITSSKGKRVAGAIDEETARIIDPDNVNEWTMANPGDRAKIAARSKKWGLHEHDGFEREMYEDIDALDALFDAYESASVMSAKQLSDGRGAIKAARDALDARLRIVGDANSMARMWNVSFMQVEDAAHADKLANISTTEAVALLGSPTLGTALIAGSATPKAFAWLLQNQGGQRALKMMAEASRLRVNKSVSGILAAGARVGRQRAARAPVGGSERAEFEHNMKLVEEYQADKPGALDRAFQRMQPMSAATPQTAQRFGMQIVRSMDAASAAVPRMPRSAAFVQDKDGQLKRVPRSDMAKFNATVRGLTNPIGVLDDIEKGTVTTEAIEGFKIGSPALFKEVQRQLQEQLLDAGEPLPYRTAVRLSRLFDMPMHPSLEPGRIAGLQQIARGAGEEGAPKPVTGSATRAPDLAESFATRTEQIQGTARG